MADIFLSYKTSDRPRAEALKRWFKECGWTVWMDREAQIGGSWSDEIQHELDIAKVVVVLWGAEARRSDWVVREATEALQTGRLVSVFATGLPLLPPFDSVQGVRFESFTGEDFHTEKIRLLTEVARRLDVEAPPISVPVDVDPTEAVDLDRFSLVELVLHYCTLHLEWRNNDAAGLSVSAVIDELRLTFQGILRYLMRASEGEQISVSEDPLHPMVGKFLEELQKLAPLRGVLT